MDTVTERTKVEEYSIILFGVGVYVGAWRGSFPAIPVENLDNFWSKLVVHFLHR